MKRIETRMINLGRTFPHAHNREFPTIGEDWQAFVADVAANGILEPLVVRVKAETLKSGKAEKREEAYECIQGHRRRLAGLEVGIKDAMCVVVECDDEEAFREMWRGNVHRLNPDPVDEARYVRGMMDLYGATVEGLAAELKRSVEWVKTRQRLLDLGDEVCEAMRAPEGRRLTMGAVEEILRVPAEWWPEAVQLVLHPELDLGVLNAEQARETIRTCLVVPRARAEVWEGMRDGLLKTWRKELAGLLPKEKRADLAVQVRSLEDSERLRAGHEVATERVPLELCLPDAPRFLTWLDLAVKHGLAVQVVAVTGKAEMAKGGKMEMGSRAVVDGVLLREAENAAAEHGGEVYLVTRKGGAVQRVPDAVTRAKAVAEGEGDPLYQDDGEQVETVIEQTMEHAAMIDMGAVKRLALWAVSATADPNDAPEWVPRWAREMAYAGEWERIDAVVAWVRGLKK